MTSRSALERVLTSLLYRVTIHGVARLTSSSNPALTFVANFPHCLQRAGIRICGSDQYAHSAHLPPEHPDDQRRGQLLFHVRVLDAV